MSAEQKRNFTEQAALISEGQCPHGHGALERQGGHGWCARCSLGFKVGRTGDEAGHLGAVWIEEVAVIEADVSTWWAQPSLTPDR